METWLFVNEAGARVEWAAMISPINLALVGGLLLEAINLRFCAFPIDVGLPANIPWYTRLLADQWLLLHLPGVVSLGWLNRLGLERFDSFALFLSGYVETVLLLVAGIVFWQLVRARSTGHSAESGPSAAPGD
jgi:hypothetical protein